MSFDRRLGFRPEADAHKDHLINVPDRPTKPLYRRLDDMLGEVFNDQPTIFGANQLPLPIPTTAAWPAGQLNQLFYRLRLGARPLVYRGTANGTPLGSTAEDCADQLFDAVFQSTGSDVENRPRTKSFVLTGDVGRGKSAFVKDLLSSDAVFNWVKNGSGWFIRINLERVLSSGRFSKLDFYREIVVRIRKLTDRATNWQELNLFLDAAQRPLLEECVQIISTTDSENVARSSVVKCLQMLSKTAFRREKLVIIVDNVDFVFHQRDELKSINLNGGEATFDDPNESLLFLFYSLVRELTAEEGEWSALNANFLFVMRDDTFVAIQDNKQVAGGMPHTTFSERERFSIIHQHDDHVPALVLLTRLNLLLVGIRLLLGLELLGPQSSKLEAEKSWQNLDTKVRHPIGEEIAKTATPTDAFRILVRDVQTGCGIHERRDQKAPRVDFQSRSLHRAA